MIKVTEGLQSQQGVKPAPNIKWRIYENQQHGFALGAN